MPVYCEDTAHIEVRGPINLAATFLCGQAFRWKALSPDSFEGVAGGRRAVVSREPGGIAIRPCTEADYEAFWRHYLDLDTDYGALETTLAADAVLGPAVCRCSGLRILNQPVWECFVSFLLSSNNNIKRIGGIVERLSARFGDSLGGGFFAFPTPGQMLAAGEDGVRGCGAGYRAAYVFHAAKAVSDGFDADALPRLGYAAAREALLGLKGVGEKVADCVLLYSCGCSEAFPVDVWVRRAVSCAYRTGDSPAEIRRFAAEHFGCLAGLAQQHLFHYERVIKKTS